MSEIIECPSGLSGEIRGLKGKDMSILTDRAAMRSGQFVDKLLAACWGQTLDVGPYQFSAEDPVPWGKVLVGDRFFAIMKIRSLMYGPEYSFRVQCAEKGCRHRFAWEVNLDELPVRKLSPEDAAGFAQGNRLHGTLPDGRGFTFRLATGDDEAKFSKASAGSFLPLLAARVIEVEGATEGSIRRFFENESMGLAFQVLAEMDRHDCGIDTNFEIECPECGGVQDISIPFDQGFLVPDRRLK